MEAARFRSYGDVRPGQRGMFRVGAGEPGGIRPNPPRTVASYAKGTHLPNPYLAFDGWRCRDCLKRLRTYRYGAQQRLRHYWRENRV